MPTQTNATTLTTDNVFDDYDSPWKDAVEHYFPEFMGFYFAEANT